MVAVAMGSSYAAAVTVLEVIQRGAEFLTKKGVESPRLQVELLLAHVLKMPRMQLYLSFARDLDASQVATVRKMVARRGQREPLQHIVGTAPFCGHEFRVNRHVLVPRPETELLAERAFEFLGRSTASPVTVLDFGTGSGCLAIAMAAKFPAAQVHAVDISPEALEVAKENASLAEAPVQFHQGDGFTAIPGDLRFDLIVSNPPYIPSAEIASLDPEVRDFDPRLALDGGLDGLEFYRKLAVWARGHLQPSGRLMIEFGEGQAPSIESLLLQHKWIVEAVVPDYSQRHRLMIADPGRD